MENCNAKGDICNINISVYFNADGVSAESSSHNRKSKSTPDVTAKRPRVFPETQESTVEEDLDGEVGASFADNTSARLEATQLYNSHLGNDNYYQMNQYPKGRVLIINNNFRGNKQRKGSSNDVQKLQMLFHYIGSCPITVLQNLTAQQIVTTVESFAKSSTTQGFCAVFIMSHGRCDSTGRIDVLVGNDNSTVNVRDLVASFKSDCNPNLKHIPVMMFFQMCRGANADRDVNHFMPVEQHTVRSSMQNDITDSDDDDQWLRNVLSALLPEGKFICPQKDVVEDVADADPGSFSETVDVPDETGSEHIGDEPNMLISFSTMERYMSFRSEGEGSWFIQAICKIFREHAPNEDIIALMNRVHIKVHGRIAHSSSRKLDGCRVCSRTTHSFEEKKLYFFPGRP